MRFRAVVELSGKTATGFVVPDEVVAGLGGRKRVAVRVTINSHEYRSTITPYQGRTMLPLSAENREAAGVAAGQEVEVDVEVDEAPREVEVPADLLEALDRAPVARETFDALSYSAKRAHVLSVEGAKTPETRLRRVDKVVNGMLGH